MYSAAIHVSVRLDVHIPKLTLSSTHATSIAIATVHLCRETRVNVTFSGGEGDDDRITDR